METAMAMPETLCYTVLETPVGRLYVVYAGETPRLVSAREEEIFLAQVRKVCGMRPMRSDGARLRIPGVVWVAFYLVVCPATSGHTQMTARSTKRRCDNAE